MSEPLTQISRYPYRPITANRSFAFPGGERVGLVIYLNIEHFPIDVPHPAPAIYPGTQHMVPDILNYGWRDYGNRVGIWRLMDLLQSFGLRASVNLHSDVCREYPELIDAGEALGWEWIAQADTAASILTGMPEEWARAIIRKSVSTIAEKTGRRPKGWLGSHLAQTPESPDLLAEEGIEFVCDYACDDQPFPVRVRQGDLISIPYTLEANDVPGVLGKGLTAHDFAQLLIDQFDELYEEGSRIPRVMPISLHPFISGHAFRVRHLRRALQHIATQKGVWIGTCGELNQWCRELHGTDPDAAL
jgi:peptidoglycan/xylan/chitin deacetylase (PgdA/CDA1 family)